MSSEPAEPTVPLVVVLRAPGGRPFDVADATAEGVAAGRLAPAAEDVERVRRYLDQEGWDLDPVAGIAITGRAPVAFVDGVLGPESADGYAVDRLPEEIAGCVAAITRDRPPDFGPGSF